MAMLLPGCVFIHCRRTGGTWAREAIRNAQIPVEGESGDESMEGRLRNHMAFSECDAGDRKPFGFIRHPLSWLKSVWAFAEVWGWDWLPELQWQPDATLSQWLQWVALTHRGFVGREYQRMFAGVLDCGGMLGRTEDLPVSLIQMLRKVCRHGFGKHSIFSTPKKNMTGSDRYYVSGYARESIVKAEIDAIGMWEDLQI